LLPAFFDSLDEIIEVSTHAVHFIDKTNSRHVIAIGLAPYGLTLWFHTLYTVEDNHTAIQYAQRTLYLCGKVDMSWCVN
jgi:hypothetical protein